MTKNDEDELLLFAATCIWCRRFPDLPRDLVRSNVSSALNLIFSGLLMAQICGMTGEINEVTNYYEVRNP